MKGLGCGCRHRCGARIGEVEGRCRQSSLGGSSHDSRHDHIHRLAHDFDGYPCIENGDGFFESSKAGMLGWTGSSRIVGREYGDSGDDLARPAIRVDHGTVEPAIGPCRPVDGIGHDVQGDFGRNDARLELIPGRI